MKAIAPTEPAKSSALMLGSAVELVIYCADIGSAKNQCFGWARTLATGTAIDQSTGGGTEMRELVEMVFTDIGEGRAIALGFECPLFVPVRNEPDDLLKQRSGESGRPWSAGAGAQVLTMGVAQVAWLLAEVRHRRPGLPFHLDWPGFTRAAAGLFLWEAFVSGKAKAASHVGDATVAAEAFRAALPNPTAENAVTADRPLSLLGAALVWAGWSDDPNLLRKACLVIKPSVVAFEAADARAVAKAAEG